MSRETLAKAVSGMLARAVELEQRLQRLREGGGPPVTLRTRLSDLVRGADREVLPPRPVLSQLSRGLSRLGVHTRADAQLLRRALEDAQALELAARLAERCERALRELETALRRVERAARNGAALAERRMLASEMASLVRVLRLISILHAPAEPLVPDAADGEGAPVALEPPDDRPHAVFNAPRLAIAAALEARSTRYGSALRPQRLDLEVAHALLLDVDPGEEERAAALRLRWRVVQARDALTRQGDAEDVPTLLREVRGLARRDPNAAYQRLWGLHRTARLDGRHAVADAAGRALEVMAGPPQRWGPDASRVAAAFGMEAAPASQMPKRASQADALSVALFGQSFGRDPEHTRLLELGLGAARFVDVEHAGTGLDADAFEQAPDPPVRAGWPQARLEIERTGSPSRASDFIIEDPRRILLDLAAGRQAVRAFVERPSAPKPQRRSSARIYVCDASASMQGARARFRDALLLAELESLLLREHRGLPVDPFYYCYFDDRMGPLQRVDDGTTALRHVDRLLASTPASGRTDINLALLAAFDAIVQARGRDPALARASVVLITDGEDAIDPDLILRAREPLRTLSISLSLVSLGQENPALRRLAQSQQRQRQRAFYLHLSDADLRWASDAFSAPVRSLAPEHWSPDEVDLEVLEPHLVALEQVAKGQDITSPPVSDAAFEARFPVEPTRATAAAIPLVSAERVLGILEALEATVALLPLERRAAECVWLLDHLLALHGQTLPGWQAGVAAGGPEVSASLARLRLIARRPGTRDGRASAAARSSALVQRTGEAAR
jgi:Mg-chelatase subunit ChlD